MTQSPGDPFSETGALIDELREQGEDFQRLLHLMAKARGDVKISKKILKKTIDETWVTAIENALPALDRVIRNPGRDIKETEEVLSIELSRHIVPRSLQHLGQHSDYIKKVNKDGSVTPSKILNVFRDENLETYENKFVNTLVDRLQKFIYRRYEKLRAAGNDESGAEMSVDIDLKTKTGAVNLSLSLAASEKQADAAQEDPASAQALWQRVEHLKRAVDRFSQAPLMVALHGVFVRPPIMRTNTILKNQYYKQCLVLWQFIESYDKVGYTIDATETLEKPDQNFIEGAYSLLALQYLLFYYNTMGEPKTEAYRTRSAKPLKPRYVRTFEDRLLEDYDLHEVQNQSLEALFPAASRKRLTPEQLGVRSAIDCALASEEARERALAREERRKEQARERARKAKAARAAAEREKKAKAAAAEKERARLEKEKQKAREKAAREREKQREKLRLEKEKQKAREKAAREREKQREKLRLEKEKQKMREKAAREREKQREKLKRDREKQRQKKPNA